MIRHDEKKNSLKLQDERFVIQFNAKRMFESIFPSSLADRTSWLDRIESRITFVVSALSDETIEENIDFLVEWRVDQTLKLEQENELKRSKAKFFLELIFR